MGPKLTARLRRISARALPLGVALLILFTLLSLRGGGANAQIAGQQIFLPSIFHTGIVEPLDRVVWRALPLVVNPRTRLGVAAVNGKIYAVGGLDSSLNAVAAVEEYDPATNTWRARAAMLTPRSRLGVAAVNGRVYALGGVDSSLAMRALLEEYDPVSDAWRQRTPLASPRSRMGLAAVDGKLYAVGGLDSDLRVLNTVEEYDPIADSWRVRAAMPTPRARLALAVSRGKLYAVGGYSVGAEPSATDAKPVGDVLAVVEEYDPVTDTWRSLPPMPTPRLYLGLAATSSGKLYAVGGLDGNLAPITTVEELDPLLDEWTSRPGLLTPRSGLGLVAIDSKLYAIGGTPRGIVEEATVR